MPIARTHTHTILNSARLSRGGGCAIGWCAVLFALGVSTVAAQPFLSDPANVRRNSEGTSAIDSPHRLARRLRTAGSSAPIGSPTEQFICEPTGWGGWGLGQIYSATWVDMSIGTGGSNFHTPSTCSYSMTVPMGTKALRLYSDYDFWDECSDVESRPNYSSYYNIEERCKAKESWSVSVTASGGTQLYADAGVLDVAAVRQSTGWAFLKNVWFTPSYIEYAEYGKSQVTTVDIRALTQVQPVTINILVRAWAGMADGSDFNALGLTFTAVADHPPISILDPVPDLARGGGVVTNKETLATKGRPVTAIAADSASRVVLRIPANSANERLTLTLVGDGKSTSSEQDGKIAPMQDAAGWGAMSTGTVQLKTVTTRQGPMAFALYFPPADFSRGAWDYNEGSRFVRLQVDSLDDSTHSYTTTLNIFRPPVVLVHGLWDNADSWRGFISATDEANLALSVTPTSYANSLNGRVDPTCTVLNCNTGAGAAPLAPRLLGMAQENSLGLGYNAPIVLEQIKEAITRYRNSRNAAATQADVVGHSMGGLVSRALQTLPDFAQADSFGKGNIHKLITIGTPHLGSPFATLLLQDSCVQWWLAWEKHPTFGNNVPVLDRKGVAQMVSGAIWDLRGDADGVGGGLSEAVQALRQATSPQVPTALIAGKMGPANLSGLAWWESLAGRGICPLSPLVGKLTQSAYPTVFNSKDSDGMVAVTSQLFQVAGSSRSGHYLADSPTVVHSKGLQSLKFNGPVELDQGSNIPAKVVELLNAPLNAFYSNFSN